MTHKVVPAINVLIIEGNKVLLSRRQNTDWMDGSLCLPGGHIELGETPSVAMLREIVEELGVQVNAEDLLFLCVAARKSTASEHISFVFLLKDKKYTFINNESEKCSELVWADVHNLPKDVIDDFRIIIESGYSNNEKYLEIGY